MDSDKYNPYCDVCTACGEAGCCSPVYCEFTDGCKYKDTYLKDLKYGYLLFQRLYDFLDKTKEEDINKIEEQTYKEIYEEDK